MNNDSNLKWDDHINAFIPKISFKFGKLRFIRKVVPIETLKPIYNAIVQKHFDSSHIVYDSTSKTNKEGLPKLQTTIAFRLLTRSGLCISHICLFQELSWLSFQHRHDFHKFLCRITVDMACSTKFLQS